MQLAGTWELQFWRRNQPDGTVTFPFGEHPTGLLIYTPDGSMAVQLVTQGRPKLDTSDALGGTQEERAQAYSTCLAYFGRYRVEGDQVIHQLEGSLFPNWSGTEQVRPFLHQDQTLVLQVKDASGVVTNALGWVRRQSSAEQTLPSDPQRRLEAFVTFSTLLTGFGPLELYGTGVADEYLQTLERAVPTRVLEPLLAFGLGQSAAPSDSPADPLEAQLNAQVLNDPDLGPVARNLIMLWYTGTWNALPDAWHTRHGQPTLDAPKVVSTAAYLSGLQWRLMGTHAPGGNPQGFGSWANPPESEV